MYGHSQKFAPQGSQGRSIKKINQFRNEFIHFIPKGWSLEVSGLPHICIDCLNILEFLGWSSGNVVWRDDQVQTRAEEAIKIAKNYLEALNKTYNKKSV